MHPPPSPARADFSIMMDCMQEIGHCHSVCTLCPGIVENEPWYHSHLPYCVVCIVLVKVTRTQSWALYILFRLKRDLGLKKSWSGSLSIQVKV